MRYMEAGKMLKNFKIRHMLLIELLLGLLIISYTLTGLNAKVRNTLGKTIPVPGIYKVYIAMSNPKVYYYRAPQDGTLFAKISRPVNRYGSKLSIWDGNRCIARYSTGAFISVNIKKGKQYKIKLEAKYDRQYTLTIKFKPSGKTSSSKPKTTQTTSQTGKTSSGGTKRKIGNSSGIPGTLSTSRLRLSISPNYQTIDTNKNAYVYFKFYNSGTVNISYISIRIYSITKNRSGRDVYKYITTLRIPRTVMPGTSSSLRYTVYSKYAGYKRYMAKYTGKNGISGKAYFSVNYKKTYKPATKHKYQQTVDSTAAATTKQKDEKNAETGKKYTNLKFEISPNVVTATKTQEHKFKLGIKNSGKYEAENVTVSFIDGSDRLCKLNFGKIPHGKTVTRNLTIDLEVSSYLTSRNITAKVEGKNTGTITKKIKMIAKRPSSLELTIKPSIVYFDYKNMDLKITISNNGDLRSKPANLYLSFTSNGQELYKKRKVEKIYEIAGNKSKVLNVELSKLFKAYVTEKSDLPPSPGKINFYLTGKDDHIITSCYLQYRYPGYFKPELQLKVDKTSVTYDLTPKENNNEEEEEILNEVEEGIKHILNIGTPFNISVENNGTLSAKDLKLVFVYENGKEKIVVDIPILLPKKVSDSLDTDTKTYYNFNELPAGKAFLKKINYKPEVKNKYTLILFSQNKEIARKTLYLTVLKNNLKVMIAPEPEEKTAAIETVSPFPKLMPDEQDTVMVHGKYYQVMLYIYKSKALLIVLNDRGEPVTNKKTAYMAAWTYIMYRDFVKRDIKIDQHREIIRSINQYMLYEHLAGASLFVRNAAISAIVKAGVYHLIGITFTKDAVTVVTKQALSEAVERIVSDPLTYLKALIKGLMLENLVHAKKVIYLLEETDGKVLEYAQVNQIIIYSESVRVHIIPRMKLNDALKPESTVENILEDTVKHFNKAILSEINSLSGGTIPVFLLTAKIRGIAKLMDSIFVKSIPAYVDYKNSVEEMKLKAYNAQKNIEKDIDQWLDNGYEFQNSDAH